MFHDADHGALEASPLLLLVGQAVGGAVGERPYPLDQVVRNHAGDVAVTVTNELPTQLCTAPGRRIHDRESCWR